MTNKKARDRVPLPVVQSELFPVRSQAWPDLPNAALFVFVHKVLSDRAGLLVPVHINRSSPTYPVPLDREDVVIFDAIVRPVEESHAHGVMSVPCSEKREFLFICVAQTSYQQV
jgi:hypothetical protein